ncbi:hypothetical protein [Owenweeksia hongkongensis]|uniref:hypothetical protein n=1 Tax=Owenweeksia hongkongensis TaxID=253245 RepID=UPI003A8EEF13
MKLLYLLIPALLLTACGEEPETYTEYTPVLLKRSDLEKSIKVESARPINDAGKIYRKGSLLFINEKFEGVHVYNNADPKKPVALGFIKIPGNVDITINNDIIYADNAVDLVALRYSNEQIQILDRDRDVFPEIVAPDFGNIPDEYTAANRPENTVIVKWEKL